MKNLVFDAWPLLAFFLEESEARSIEQMLIESQHNETQLLISTINAGEIWYSVSRVHGQEEADRIVENMRKMNISIDPVDWQLTRIAAGFKVFGGISYADCFAAALAKQKKATLVTGDPEFRRLEGEIEIAWI